MQSTNILAVALVQDEHHDHHSGQSNVRMTFQFWKTCKLQHILLEIVSKCKNNSCHIGYMGLSSVTQSLNTSALALALMEHNHHDHHTCQSIARMPSQF